MKLKNVLGNSSVVLVACLSVVGCAKKSYNSNQIVKNAPQDEKSTGFIVEGPTSIEVDESLVTNSKLKVRVLNQRHNMYEFLNSSESELQKLFPESKIAKNHYFQFFDRPFAESKRQGFAGLKSLFASDNNSSEFMASCLNPQESEKLQIELVRGNISGNTLDQSQQLILSANATELNEPDLKIGWLVFRPLGTALPEKSFTYNGMLTFASDTLGEHGVILVAKNAQDNCFYKVLPLVITSNEPYRQLNEQELETPTHDLDLSLFKHLDLINGQSSWLMSTGKGITIAIIDSGANYNHWAINQNIAVNPTEIPDNALDDDGNGFIDDVYGYDFVNADAFPFDDDGHGSHVAGLAASSYFGAAKNAKILPIKALSGSGGGDLGSISAAIRYATDSGAQVINMSLGGYAQAPNEILAATIDYAESKGVLLISASGNGHPVTGIGLNTDVIHNYPSGLPNKNIISVAARDSVHALATYSNFGIDTVDVVAPGGSADPSDRLTSSFARNAAHINLTAMSGTSMASPVVAGVAAQVLSLNKNLKPEEVAQILMSTGPEVEELKGKIKSGRFIDARDALVATLKTKMMGLL